MKAPVPEFHRPIRVADLADDEYVIEIAADAAERQALATRFALLGLDRLEASLVLKPQAAGGSVQMEGTLRAHATQACVVSLQPVEAPIEAGIQRVYAFDPPSDENGDVGSSLLEQDDPPDPIVDGTIDIGEAVAEQLALELDPFPRAPGAQPFEFSDKINISNELKDDPSPFAVLAKLERKR